MTPDIPTIQAQLQRDIPTIGQAVGRYREAVTGLNAAIADLRNEEVDGAMQALMSAVQVAYTAHVPAFYAALTEHLAAFEVLRQACADAALVAVLDQQPISGHMQ